MGVWNLTGRPQHIDREKCAIIAQSHLNLARQIEDSYKYLKSRGSDSASWALVTAFYCAVNLVDSIIRGKGYNPKKHEGEYSKDFEARNFLVRHVLIKVYEDYIELFNYSIQARYLPDHAVLHKPSDVEVADKALKKIQTAINNKIGNILQHHP